MKCIFGVMRLSLTPMFIFIWFKLLIYILDIMMILKYM